MMYKYEAISSQIFESEKEKEFRLAREREAQIVQQRNNSEPDAFMTALADNWVHAIQRLCKFFIKVDLELRLRERKQLGTSDARDVQKRIQDFINSEILNLKMTLASKFKARGVEGSKITEFLPTLDSKTNRLIDLARNDILSRINPPPPL